MMMVLDKWSTKCSYDICSSLGKTGGKKENFWNELFSLMSYIPQNEMVVLAGDMNGHVGIMLAMMECMVVMGMELGIQDFGVCRQAKLVICNTLFMKQQSKLVTYVRGPAKTAVNYIIVQQGGFSKIKS